MSKTKYEHLVKNLPNTKENRDLVKKVNKMSREAESHYKLLIKYRKPKEGFKYGSGGSLKRENANAFSVYIQDRRGYYEQPLVQRNFELIRQNNKLIDENSRLRKEVALQNNPYIDWSASNLEDEVFETKESILDCVLDSQTIDSPILIDNKKKYYQLLEALEYARQND